MRNSVSDRVSPHGQPAHMSRIKTIALNCSISDPPYEPLSLSRHRSPTGVNVVVRLRSTGQGKITKADGAFDKEFSKFVFGGHSGAVQAERLVDDKLTAFTS